MGQAEAQQLRGKLIFADNEVHGRIGPLFIKAFSDHIHVKGFTSAASYSLLTASARLKNRLTDGESSEIRAAGDRTLYVSSDALFGPTGSDTGLQLVWELLFTIRRISNRITSLFSKMLGPSVWQIP